MEDLRRSTVRQKRERLRKAAEAAAAGEDGTAAEGAAAADGLQEEWAKVNVKFDLVLKEIVKLEKLDLNTIIPVEVAKMVVYWY